MRMQAPLFIASRTRGLMAFLVMTAAATAQQMPQGMEPQGPPPLQDGRPGLDGASPTGRNPGAPAWTWTGPRP